MSEVIYVTSIHSYDYMLAYPDSRTIVRLFWNKDDAINYLHKNIMEYYEKDPEYFFDSECNLFDDHIDTVGKFLDAMKKKILIDLKNTKNNESYITQYESTLFEYKIKKLDLNKDDESIYVGEFGTYQKYLHNNY